MFNVKAISRLVRPAPALPKPGRRVKHVSNTAELFAAAEAAKPGTTILLADGTYRVRGLTIAADGIALRGASGDRARVVLDGGGAFDKMVILRGAKDFLLADLTMRNCRQYGLLFYGDSDVQRLRVWNCVFRNIWTRAVKGTHPRRILDSPHDLNTLSTMRRIRPTGGEIRHCLFVNDRVKPYDDPFNGDYVSGLDAMWLKDWTIADNAFVGIRGQNGHARGAVFVWVHSEAVTTERNVFVGCDRAVAYGNPTGERPHMTGGIVRNNLIVGGAHRAIEMESTRDTLVAHNSVWATQTVFPTVTFDHGCNGSRLANNLIHGGLYAFGALRKSGNVIGDLTGWFADPLACDFRLTDAAGAAIGRGRRLPKVREDFAGRPRPARADLGAYQTDPSDSQ